MPIDVRYFPDDNPDWGSGLREFREKMALAQVMNMSGYYDICVTMKIGRFEVSQGSKILVSDGEVAKQEMEVGELLGTVLLAVGSKGYSPEQIIASAIREVFHEAATPEVAKLIDAAQAILEAIPPAQEPTNGD